MCNKILVKIIHQISSNSCSKNISNSVYLPILGTKPFDNLNSKQFQVTTRAFPIPRNFNNVFTRSFLLSSRSSCNYESQSNFFQCSSSTSPYLLKSRLYCTEKQVPTPKIMNIPEVIWPSVFKTIRNWILSNFIIARYFDNEFNLPEFVNGSKQAIELVSGYISKGDVESLTGLATPEVIAQVKDSLEILTLKQRQEFAIKQEDIFFCFPFEVGVMFPNENKIGADKENQSRFVEITMCYHAMQGLQEYKEQGLQTHINMGAMPEHHEKIFICNYRFIREFTKGVQDDWTINAVNHFKPMLSAN